MALINVKPIILTNVTLKIAANNYEAHVSSVTFTPSVSTQTWKGLTPSAVFTLAGKSTWECGLEFAQDWETPDSLSNYLFSHEGDVVAMEFKPVAGGVGFSASVSIVPGAIGGAVDSFATASVTLPVQGRPAVVPTV